MPLPRQLDIRGRNIRGQETTRDGSYKGRQYDYRQVKKRKPWVGKRQKKSCPGERSERAARGVGCNINGRLSRRDALPTILRGIDTGLRGAERRELRMIGKRSDLTSKTDEGI